VKNAEHLTKFSRYEKTWQAFRAESISKDPTEFGRLYDKLSELRSIIDGVLCERDQSPRRRLVGSTARTLGAEWTKGFWLGGRTGLSR